MTDQIKLEDFYQPIANELGSVANRIGLKQGDGGSANIFKQLLFTEEKKENNSNKSKSLIIDDVSRDKSRIRIKKKYKDLKKRKHTMRAKQRRQLFQSHAKPKNLRYEVFHNIHQLWLQYARNLIQNAISSSSSLDVATSKTAEMQKLLSTMVKADYHGARMLVCQSRNPNLIGIKGIVFKETRNTFQMINEMNKVHIVPKKSCIFAFQVDGKVFKLNGNFVHVNAHQRTRLKFKSTKSTVEL